MSNAIRLSKTFFKKLYFIAVFVFPPFTLSGRKLRDYQINWHFLND